MAFTNLTAGVTAVISKLPAVVAAGLAAKLIACIGQTSPPCPGGTPGGTATTTITSSNPGSVLDGVGG